MNQFANNLNNLIQPLRGASKCILSPIFDFGVRLYMANIFFTSGWLKFGNFLNDDWESTTFLFEEIHPIPFLNPSFAAISGTAAELILPVLLVLGLFARLGAVGLLVMTAMIQFAVPADYGIQHDQHYFWMFLLGMIVLKGPGRISLDHLIQKWLKK
jgi:putative oxidoreductase